MESFLLQASIFLAAAVIAVPLAARLGLGSVLGYLAAGILIGPVFGFVGGHETQELQHFAEFGVVMMLFLIGLELEPRTLWDMRHKLIGLGGLQIGLSTVLIMTGAMVLGLVWQVALAVGLIFALSSTAIVLQTLSEKGLMQTGGGRSTFAVLLTQDIAVIPMLALLPLLAVMPSAVIAPDGAISLPAKEAEDAAHAGMSLVEGLPGWGVTLVTLGAVAAVILAGIYLVRPLFQFVHTARLRELNTALALLIVVGIGTLMNMVGLSPALGTFLAGVVLANSEFRHELESDIEPFKGLLLGLFFITVGAGIDFATFFGAPFKILGLTLAVIAAKGAVLLCLAMIFGLRGRNRWLFTLGLAQAGEFGFVLNSFSVTQNILPPGLSQTLLLVVALSMLITPLLFILYELLSRRMSERGEAFEPDEIDEQGPVIIAGIGRFGFKGFYGDPTRPELLHAAGLREARVLVVALDVPAATLRLVSFARRERDDLHIVARAHDRTHAFKLYQAGANDIVREMFDSSLRAGRYVLENIGLTEYEAAEAERVFYQHDRHSVQELAKLWRDDIPSVDNEPYIARAKELERDLEALLLAQLQKEDAA